MPLSQISEEVEPAHEVLTALPQWDSHANPNRSLHSRHGSQDPVLEKSIFAKEIILGSCRERSGTMTPEEEETPKPRHSRAMFWLVLCVVVTLIVAVVLGAVLGTLMGPSGGSSTPQSTVTNIPAETRPTPTSSTPPTTSKATPTPTYQFASLAVAGWTVPGPNGYFTSSLFSQDNEGFLSRATFNSSTGNWTRVSKFAIAKPGTPIAATFLNTKYYTNQTNYDFRGINYQTSVVYLDNSNYLKEWIFSDTGSALGRPGPLTDQKYIAHEKTQISYYWPRLLYQGMSGEIRGAHFECHKRGECWHDTVLRTTDARNGTQLVAVPMWNNLSSIGLFYEQDDGKFVNYKEDWGRASAIWKNRAFSDKIPPEASVAAFSTIRPEDVDDLALNTYLLWQNNNGTIQMSWTDSDKGWKGPIKPTAFKGADKNTALTCLTGATFPKFPLPPGNELSRCYFQANNTLREVNFNGTSWDVVGTIPIES
ncbi:hypothetical protein P154DRAFT_350205 [Amniculicola lignicola CBS 123094]|uniref:Fucose-specific lectin n=1 Tax=Amniculicola lignicola CBS 123094 TaxID=1392246 RepID=A0A6A5W1I6_9PLEO|nr:hypothetical protein P154DRAFT_350205 [Amniculicola lignicola CBS 123094]